MIEGSGLVFQSEEGIREDAVVLHWERNYGDDYQENRKGSGWWFWKDEEPETSYQPTLSEEMQKQDHTKEFNHSSGMKINI